MQVSSSIRLSGTSEKVMSFLFHFLKSSWSQTSQGTVHPTLSLRYKKNSELVSKLECLEIRRHELNEN